MNEEEKEALRNFKSEYETCNYNSSDLIIELDDAKIILNLIDKQQKEIKDMRKELDLDEETEIALNNRIMDLERKIDKQNKVIDEMAEDYNFDDSILLDNCAYCNHNYEDCHGDYCKEALINYFYRRAEENDKD